MSERMPVLESIHLIRSGIRECHRICNVRRFTSANATRTSWLSGHPRVRCEQGRTYSIFISLEEAVYIVRKTSCLVILSGYIQELLSDIHKSPAVGHLQRTRVSMGGLPWCNLVRFALYQKGLVIALVDRRRRVTRSGYTFRRSGSSSVALHPGFPYTVAQSS